MAGDDKPCLAAPTELSAWKEALALEGGAWRSHPFLPQLKVTLGA